jgi:hypothetical protein
MVQTTFKRSHVIAISPVHWRANCCLATSYKHSSYCCLRLSRDFYRVVVWHCVDILQYIHVTAKKNYICSRLYLIYYRRSTMGRGAEGTKHHIMRSISICIRHQILLLPKIRAYTKKEISESRHMKRRHEKEKNMQNFRSNWSVERDIFHFTVQELPPLCWL